MTPEERARDVMVRVFGVPDPSLSRDKAAVYVQVAERGYGSVERALAQAIREAVAEEREACVRICEDVSEASSEAWHFDADECAGRIRARGESDE